MKRFLLFSLCLFLLVTASACTQNNSQPQPSGSSAPERSSQQSSESEAQHTAVEKIEPNAGEVPDFLDEEQQLLYRRAKTAYCQFRLNNDGFGSVNAPPLEEKLFETDYRVCNGAFTTWQEFEDAMLTLFTADYFAELNDASYTDSQGMHTRLHFAEHEGKLCFAEGARGSNITFIPPETFELISKTDTEIQFYVVGKYWSESPEETTPPTEEKQLLTMVLDNGQWKFSAFALAY